MDDEQALQKGLEDKGREFVEAGSEIYKKV
jgi:hypothetical protein